MKDHWLIRSKGPLSVRRHDDILQRILEGRGISDPRSVDEYLHPRLSDLHSPFLMEDMEKAVGRIRKAIANKETIGIFSDSDLDGITAMVTLNSLLTRLGAMVQLRHLQDDEQYGLTREIVDELAGRGVTLLITADSGIRDIDEIHYATSLGIETIITDHHEEDTAVPQCLVLNPKVKSCGYPFRDLAGVGVAVKLCMGLLLSYLPSYNRLFLLVSAGPEGIRCAEMINGVFANGKSVNVPDNLPGTYDPGATTVIGLDRDSIAELRNLFSGFAFYTLAELAAPLTGGKEAATLDAICSSLALRSDLYENRLVLAGKILSYVQMASSQKIMNFLGEALGNASIGSVADVVPLTGENRIMVREGLRSLEKTVHPGLSLLVKNGPVNAKKIGWGIAPLLNSPGRVGKTALTLNFFLEQDPGKSRELLQEIESLNVLRKTMVRDLCNDLIESHRKDMNAHKNIVVVKSERIAEGFAGLIANRLSDTLRKPAIAVSLQKGKGSVKGSGRSGSGIDFFSYIQPFADRFERFGGHAQAFGFTINPEYLDGVMDMVDHSMGETQTDMMPLNIDMELPLDLVDLRLIEHLASMEPFGKGNEIATFLTRGLHISSFSRLGDGRHGKFQFSENPGITAIGWDMADAMESHHAAGTRVDLVYSLEINDFLGRREPRLIIAEMDATASGSDVA